MRILLTGVAIEGGGAERVIVDLARGLKANGHETMVAFLEGSDEVVPSLEAQGIACRRLLKRRQFAPGPLADFTPSCILQFRKLIAEFRPDIIDSHIPRPTLWVALALRLMPKPPPLIYTEHSIQQAYAGWAKAIYAIFLSRTSHVIAISEAGRQSFAERWRWPGDRISRIWNGIQPERVQPLRPATAVRTELETKSEVPLICNVANLNSCKAQEVLVRAMAILNRRLPEARCWIAGNPLMEPATAAMVKTEIAALGLEQSVRLIGPRRDVPDVLGAADVFVLSSRQEGFPITILEAMAAGRPVVATNVGGCAEAVVHGETGLIVPPEDPEALAVALLYMLTHRHQARQMGEAGRQRVSASFTVDNMVHEHLAVYEQVLAQRQIRGCSDR